MKEKYNVAFRIKKKWLKDKNECVVRLIFKHEGADYRARMRLCVSVANRAVVQARAQ